MTDQFEKKVDQLIRTVNFNLTKEEWDGIFLPGAHKLETNYTNVFYNKLTQTAREINEKEQINDNKLLICPLAFKYNKVRDLNSRKKNNTLINCSAVCKIEKCPRYFRFQINADVDLNAKTIPITSLIFNTTDHDSQNKKERRRINNQEYVELGSHLILTISFFIIGQK